ncbi:MAG: hypothetical protein ACPL07_00640, partial [Candidatus Bathyarchaeia archaeon]
MREKEFSAIFLGFLMLLTPLSNAYVVGNFLQQPKVFTETLTKTVEIEGKKYDLQGFGKVTQYSNGTELIQLSVVTGLSGIVRKLRINLTKVVTPEELDALKNPQSTSSNSEYNCKETSAITYPVSNGYTFTKETWDDLLFVINSPQIYIKYKHDDNYQSYHPGNFNEPWEFPPHVFYNDKQYQNEKIHTHMAVSDVYDWKTGAKSRDEIMRKYLTLGSTVAGSFIGALLGEGLVMLFSLTGWLEVVVTAVAAAFGAFIGWLLSLLGVSEAQWVENVIEAEQGDGFYWSWDFRTTFAMPYLLSGYTFGREPLTYVWMW